MPLIIGTAKLEQPMISLAETLWMLLMLEIRWIEKVKRTAILHQQASQQ